MRTAGAASVERRVFGAEPETVRNFNPEKHTLAGGRRVDIREPRVEEVRQDRLRRREQHADRAHRRSAGGRRGRAGRLLPSSKPAQAVERTTHSTRLTPEPERERATTEANLDARFGEPRKSGWRGLFGGGRPRPEQQRLSQTQLRTTQQSQPVEAEAVEPAGQDDLEIPSFLRRLANGSPFQGRPEEPWPQGRGFFFGTNPALSKGGGLMDIHKPKPVHGWREFLKEYGIIVLGVLTALASSNNCCCCEMIHDHSRAEDTRRSVRAEIVANIGLLQRRESIEPCVTRRAGGSAGPHRSSCNG